MKIYYKFKKMLFTNDNDFVLWELANNSNLMENIIKDPYLKLTVNNKRVTLEDFVHYAFDIERVHMVSKKHVVNYAGIADRTVWIGPWQINTYNMIKNHLDSKHDQTQTNKKLKF